MSTFVPGQLPGVEQVLFRLRGFNANAATGAAGAQKMERLIPAGVRFSISRVDAANGSIALGTATLRLDSQPAAGTSLFPATALTASVAPGLGASFTAHTAAGRGYNETTQDIWAALGTAQGAPGTCDLYVIGKTIQ